jgi:hypothetical protein
MAHQLDHVVFNTRFETDAAARLFEGLGFQLTPRGFHPTLGSINHLMVFAHDYLELIGLPPGGTIVRQELIDTPTGINGLVFASGDAKATRDEVVSRGFEAQPVQNFSRPLVIDGTAHEASFSAVRLAQDSFAAGRVYFCQHHTPELIWRRQWMEHPNGATGITELTITSADPLTTREHYARLGSIGGHFALTVVDAAALADRFGELAHNGAERTERFAAVTVRTRDPQIAAERAATLGLPHRATAGRTVVALPALDSLIEFVA